MIDNTASELRSQMEKEIRQYTTEVVNVGEAYDYSQYKLVRRITLFESKTYPTGKFDTQGNYKFWYDGISPRIANEVKNIDFDTKDITVYSSRQSNPQQDALPSLLANLKLKEYLRDTGQDEELNSAIEEGSGWGNAAWKKIKKTYERVDLKNFYVINQTARCLKESPVIERHPMISSDLRAKSDVWDNVDDVLKGLKSNTYKSAIQQTEKDTTVPYYEIYERNGDVCVADLKKVHGEVPVEADADKYVFAKVIGAGKSTQSGVVIEYIMFAEELTSKSNEDLYEEFHRGPYKGKWFREGLYELLFDLQVRLNQIGNQLAQGLELASKTILWSEDKVIVQNILSDMKNGDIIKAKNLQQVGLEMRAFSQLIEEWNIVQQQMNDIANSQQIVAGDTPPSGTPLGTSQLANQNANKLYDFVRKKLGIPFSHIFGDWVVPDLISDLSAKDILRLTGDPKMLDRLYGMIVDDWYNTNLVAIGPHGQEIADFLKQQQLDALKKHPELVMKGLKQVFKDFIPSVSVVITGENSTLPQDLADLSAFINLEQDPVRRTALIEMAMAKKGIDITSLPKSPPAALSPIQPDQNGKIPPVAPTRPVAKRKVA